MNLSKLSRRPLLAVFLFCAVLISAPLVAAQEGPLPEAAREALSEGREAMREALATYEAQYPDRPLWQLAFRHGRRAATLAPEHSEPLRFLAEAYSRANWFGPAWNAWVDYLDQGNLLDADATPLFTEIGSQQGYNYYRQGLLEEAASVYRRIVDEVPFDLEAHTWLGRLLMEMGKPEQAMSYWRTVVERNPNDARAEYFLELARAQATWGAKAVNAFREGVAFYEQGAPEQARERFARAASLNEDYAEAWAWLGRVAFERGNYADAETFYGRANRLEGTNETYEYFLEESRRRQQTERSQDARSRQDPEGRQAPESRPDPESRQDARSRPDPESRQAPEGRQDPPAGD